MPPTDAAWPFQPKGEAQARVLHITLDKQGTPGGEEPAGAGLLYHRRVAVQPAWEVAAGRLHVHLGEKNVRSELMVDQAPLDLQQKLGWLMVLGNPWQLVRKVRARFDHGEVEVSRGAWFWDVRIPPEATRLEALIVDMAWERGGLSWTLDCPAGAVIRQRFAVRWAVEGVRVTCKDAGKEAKSPGNNGPIEAVISAQFRPEDGSVDPPGQVVQFQLTRKGRAQAAKEGIAIVRVARTAEEAWKDDPAAPGASTGRHYPVVPHLGKAYCRVVIPLAHAQDLAAAAGGKPGVLGLMAILGEHDPADGPPGLLGGGEAEDQAAGPGHNVFVPAGSALVEGFCEILSWGARAVQVAVAALPDRRTALIWVFQRFLDAAMAGSYLSAFRGTPQETKARAVLAGLAIGTAKGAYNNVSGTVEDIAAVKDLAEAFFGFIAKQVRQDPMFALTLGWATIVPVPGAAPVTMATYAVHKGMEAFAHLFTPETYRTVRELVTSAANAFDPDSPGIGIDPRQIAAVAAAWAYKSFEDDVKPLAVDLGYRAPSQEYDLFVAAFIVGDIAGYVGMELGIQALLAVVTEGAGNAVRVLSKLGGVGARLGRLALHLGDAVQDFLRAIAQLVRLAKAAAGRLFAAVTHVSQRTFAFITMPFERALAAAFTGFVQTLVDLARGTGEAFGWFLAVLRQAGTRLEDLMERFVALASSLAQGALERTRLASLWLGLTDILARAGDRAAAVALQVLDRLLHLAERARDAVDHQLVLHASRAGAVARGCGTIAWLGTSAFLAEITDVDPGSGAAEEAVEVDQFLWSVDQVFTDVEDYLADVRDGLQRAAAEGSEPPGLGLIWDSPSEAPAADEVMGRAVEGMQALMEDLGTPDLSDAELESLVLEEDDG